MSLVSGLDGLFVESLEMFASGELVRSESRLAVDGDEGSSWLSASVLRFGGNGDDQS